MRRVAGLALIALGAFVAAAPLRAQDDAKDLGELEKRYAAVEPAEREVWRLARSVAAAPEDEKLGAEYHARELELKERIAPLSAALDALVEKSPADVNVQRFRLRFVSEQIAAWVIADEAAKFFQENPQDRDARVVLAKTCMVAPELRSPRFARAYEVIAPVARAEPKDEAVQLLFGVAACALGKNAEAKDALARVASLASIRPATAALIAGNLDQDATFALWKSVATGLSEKPGDADLLAKRAELLLSLGAAPLATADVEAAVVAKPKDLEIAKLARRCCAATNDYDRTVRIYERLLAASPKDDEVRAEYGLALYRANRMTESLEALGKTSPEAMARFPDALRKAVFGAGPELLIDDWAAEVKARAADAARDDDPRVRLETDRGTITLELFEDAAPNTVASFVSLAGNGFYDNVRFHRVIAGFVAQAGDPSGMGDGGPGYRLKDEVEGNPRLHWRGTLSMAKSDAPDTGGSQFFLCFRPAAHLNGKHTVFGRVIEGQEAVDQLEAGDTILTARVLRKRAHAYIPVMIPVPGQEPWKPGETPPR